MDRSKSVLAAGLWCFALVACNRSESVKAPPVKLSAEAQDRSVSLHEKMASVAEKDGTDCVKLANDLRATIMSEAPPVLGSSSLPGEMGHDAGDPLQEVAAEVAALDPPHAARVLAAKDRMQPALRACAQDANLRDTLKLLSQ